MNLNKITLLSPVFVMGDITVLILFSLLGRSFHKMEFDFSSFLLTTLPFLFFWIFIGLLIGVFSQNIHLQIWVMIKKVALNTLIAVPLAILLRQLILGRPTDLSFLYASWAAVFSFILLWRLLFTWYRSKFHRA